jgi:hypothetical protein
MPGTWHFNDPGSVPPGMRGGTGSACFSYPGDALAVGTALPPDPRGKTSTTCFRY